MQHCGMLCCKICNHSVFNKESFIVEHAKLHVEKSYECQMCSLKCSSRDIVVLHLQTFHEVTSGTVAEQFIDEISSCTIGDMREKCFPSIKQEDGTVYSVAKLSNVALERRSTAFIPNVYQVGSKMRPITIDDEPQPILATGNIGTPLYKLPPETMTNPNNYPILEKIRTVDSVKLEEAEEKEVSQQIQSQLHGMDTVTVDDSATVPGNGQFGTPAMVYDYDIDREDDMEIHLRPSEEVTPTRSFSSSEQVTDAQDEDLTHLSQNSSIVTPPPRTPSGPESVISISTPASSRVLRQRSTPTPDTVSVRRSSGKTETAPPSKCATPTPLEDKLLGYKLEQVDSEYTRRAIRVFEKRQEGNALRYLVKALNLRDSSTKCVTIKPVESGANIVTFDGKSARPHEVSARVWRWPDVTSGELQQLCCDTDSFVRNLVCINPFHYERVAPEDRCCPIVGELLKYHKKGEHPDPIARKYITYLVKRLRTDKVALDALMTAVKCGKSNTRCVTVRQFKHGQVRIGGYYGSAYLLYARIWRFPNVADRYDLRKSPHCTTSSGKVVCVNPYHYERRVRKRKEERVTVNEGESVEEEEGEKKMRRVD